MHSFSSNHLYHVFVFKFGLFNIIFFSIIYLNKIILLDLVGSMTQIIIFF
jgi:hypothetical protein